MSDPRRETLRVQFDAAAERYDRVRPGYPAQLFADLATLAGVGPGTRVLEIGPGTGQATMALAERRCAVTAVELGPSLADIARRKLSRYPGCEVVVGPFERWSAPAGAFDVVLTATSWHWLERGVRVERALEHLRVGGHLAIVETHHVNGASSFFDESQDCYVRWDPETKEPMLMPRADEVPPGRDEADETPRFGRAVHRRYEADVRYDTDDYIDLLMTYSGHLAMPSDVRAALLRCIRTLIQTRYGGVIDKRYLWEMRVLERVA